MTTLFVAEAKLRRSMFRLFVLIKELANKRNNVAQVMRLGVTQAQHQHRRGSWGGLVASRKHLVRAAHLLVIKLIWPRLRLRCQPFLTMVESVP